MTFTCNQLLFFGPRPYQFRLNGVSFSGNHFNYSILKVQRQFRSQGSQVLLEKEEKVFMSKTPYWQMEGFSFLEGKEVAGPAGSDC